MDIFIKGRQHLKLPLWNGCVKLSLSSNQIAGFFDHDFYKESTDTLVVSNGDSHQGKAAPKTLITSIQNKITIKIEKNQHFINYLT